VSAAHARRLRHPLRRACRVGGLAVLLTGLLLVPANPVRADDPTPTTKAVALASPGVVYVSTAAEMSVSVTHPALRELLGRTTVRDINTEEQVSGSGFVVNPKGIVVTASHVVSFDDDREKELKIFAVNHVFFNELGRYHHERLGSDPYEEHSLKDPNWDEFLQLCYSEVFCRITTKPLVSVITPAQGDEGKTRTVPATIATSSEFDETDITILRADATDLPTAPLAKTIGDLQPGQSIIALGFPGSADRLLKTGRTEATPVFGLISSVRSRKQGSGRVIQVDVRLESGMSGGPVLDAEGKVIGLISFSGVEDEAGGRTQGYLRAVDDIHDALKTVGVSAGPGEVDTIFAQAMNDYWTHHYSAAVPRYQRLLNLFDGHLLAKQYLTLAQAKAGGSEDLPVPGQTAAVTGQDADGTTKMLAFALLAVLVAALVVLLALPIIVWRRPRLARSWMPDRAGRGRAAGSPTGDAEASVPLDEGLPFGDGQTVAARAGTQGQEGDRHPG
jgi:S1-C subfamily serine protease